VARNADGRLEVFYVGANGDLYHNWQTAPGAAWAGETQFTGDSARQIAVAQNQDGLLEIFYVGSDYTLYHNRQLSPGFRAIAAYRSPRDRMPMAAWRSLRRHEQ
jgi:hypothetical protein